MKVTLAEESLKHLLLGGTLHIATEDGDTVQIALADIGYSVITRMIPDDADDLRIGQVRQLDTKEPEKEATPTDLPKASPLGQGTADPRKEPSSETTRSGFLVMEVRFNETTTNLAILGRHLTSVLARALVRRGHPIGLESAGPIVPGGIPIEPLTKPDPPVEDQSGQGTATATFQLTVAYDPDQTNEDMLETGLNGILERAFSTPGILDMFGEPVISALELIRDGTQEAPEDAQDGSERPSQAEAARRTFGNLKPLRVAEEAAKAQSTARYLDDPETGPVAVVVYDDEVTSDAPAVVEAVDRAVRQAQNLWQFANIAPLGITGILFPEPPGERKPLWCSGRPHTEIRTALAALDVMLGAPRRAQEKKPAGEPGTQPRPPRKMKLNNPAAQERLAHLAEAVQKQGLLVEVIRYYAWLEEHGVDLEQVIGQTTKIPMSTRVRHDLKKSGQQLGKDLVTGTREAICYMLEDASEIVLPYPPFPQEVLRAAAGFDGV